LRSDPNNPTLNEPNNPKGFWPRKRQKEPIELRHTTLALAAFKRLKDVGLAAFCQEDWQFTEEVAAQLGPRFTDWQLEGSVADSWGECEMHTQRMKELPIPLPEIREEERKKGNGDNGRRGKKNGKQRDESQPELWSLQQEEL
jgi:hypothetical protein